MSVALFMELYMLVGIGYLLVNVLVRKLDTGDDYLLPLVWMFLWWLCFIGIIAIYIDKKRNKL